MGIVEICTLIAVICKLAGHPVLVGLTWWQVLMPQVVAMGIYLVIASVVWHCLFNVKNSPYEGKE